MTGKNYYCVILAGGVGTRLWPSSKTEKPKQFIDILETGETLIQSTYRRFCGFIPKENVYVVTYSDYKEFVEEQLPDLPKENCLLEPIRRNTVPSTMWATFTILSKDMDASIVFSPSDHLINDEEMFEEDIVGGLDYVTEHKRLLSMGVMPSRPDTNYGYLQMGDEREKGVFQVKSFSEKPALEFAKMFHKSGEFLWNTGLFIVDGKTYIDTVSRASNSFQELVEGVKKRVLEGKPINDVLEYTYSRSPNTTLEQGLLEKASNIDMKLCRFEWRDLGSWSEYYNISEKDGKGNAILSDSQMLYDCENCLVKMPHGKLVVAKGLKDYLVVFDNDVLLICKKDNQQDIRRFVNDYEMKNE